MDYKKVNNIGKPGRPPSGCVWAKDKDGKLVTNSKGEVGYRKATPADLKAKKASRGTGRKKRGRKAKTVGQEVDKSLLLLKRTYKELSSAELEKVQAIAASMVDKAKDQEKRALEKTISKLKGRLDDLK